MGLINISPAHDAIIIQPNLIKNLILSFYLYFAKGNHDPDSYRDTEKQRTKVAENYELNFNYVFLIKFYS